MFFLKTFLLLFFFASPLAAIDKQQSWTLAKQENGIKVYTRAIAGSDYKAFRGEMLLNANIDELLMFINDPEQCAAWRYKCIAMRILSDGYLYKLSSLPWPFSNRYTVMQSLINHDKQSNSYTIKLSNIKRSLLPLHIQTQLPKQKNTVQMRYSDGYWQFTIDPAKNNIHIVYQMHGDAGVALPSEWTHFGIINSAFITLSNLKKHFSLPKNKEK